MDAVWVWNGSEWYGYKIQKLCFNKVLFKTRVISTNFATVF